MERKGHSLFSEGELGGEFVFFVFLTFLLYSM